VLVDELVGQRHVLQVPAFPVAPLVSAYQDNSAPSVIKGKERPLGPDSKLLQVVMARAPDRVHPGTAQSGAVQLELIKRGRDPVRIGTT
jgi:hypothetical protein